MYDFTVGEIIQLKISEHFGDVLVSQTPESARQGYSKVYDFEVKLTAVRLHIGEIFSIHANTDDGQFEAVIYIPNVNAYIACYDTDWLLKLNTPA